MSGRRIRCKYCGMKGVIDVPGLNDNIKRDLMFNYLGHDPFSGAMHFQCPACRGVLAVNPRSVIDGNIQTSEEAPSMHLNTKKYGHALFLLVVIFFKYVVDRQAKFEVFRDKLLAYGVSVPES